MGCPIGTTAVVGTVFRNTDTTGALTVILQSGNPSRVQVPSGVVIPAGQTSVSFRITVVNDSAANGDERVVISAKATGLATAKAVATITDDESP